MRKADEKYLSRRIIAGLLIGGVIGASGYTFARTTYHYDNGNGGQFATHTHFANCFAAYLGLVGGPIPVFDATLKAAKSDELAKSMEIVKTVGQIATNTQELLALFGKKNGSLSNNVFANATNVLGRATLLTATSKFNPNAKIEGSDLKVNTRLTFKGAKDADTVLKYKKELFEENAKINTEAEETLKKLNEEAEVTRTALNDVIQEKGTENMTAAALAAVVSALKLNEQSANNSVNNTSFMQSKADHDAFVKSGASNSSIASYDNKLKNKISESNINSGNNDFANKNQNYMSANQAYVDARTTELNERIRLLAEETGKYPGGYEYNLDNMNRLQQEYQALIAQEEYYRQHRWGGGEDSYDLWEWYLEQKRMMEERIAEKQQVIDYLNGNISSYDSLADKKETQVVASGGDELKSLEKTQTSNLGKTTEMETANAYLNTYDPSKMKSDSYMQSLAGQADNNSGKSLTGIEKDIASQEAQVSLLSNSSDAVAKSSNKEQTQYKNALSTARNIGTQIMVAQIANYFKSKGMLGKNEYGGDNELDATKKEQQKQVLVGALENKLEIIDEDIQTVSEKRKMYNDALMERLNEIDEKVSRASMGSGYGSHDPWHQDEKTKKENPTRKGFGWKSFNVK